MAIPMSDPTTPAAPELARQVRRLEIHARRLVADRFFGQYHSVFKGRGLEFSEVREYQPGDDVRSIDWNVTARMGTPYVKRFVEERELTVMLAVDVSASQRFGTAARRKEELAVELSGLLALAAAANNDRVGLLAFSEGIEVFLPPARGSRRVPRLIRELLAFRTGRRGTDIGAAVGYLERTLSRRAIIFLISDFLDDGFEAALRSAAIRHDVIGLVLSDPRELTLPAVGLVEAEDAETGERVWIDANEPAVRERFAKQASDARAARRQRLNSLGVDAVEISTEGSYIGTLSAYFQKRARRR